MRLDFRRILQMQFRGWTLERRLQLDATGPEIHVSYYRKDAADALEEILRLRALVNFFAVPEDTRSNTEKTDAS